jgi:peptide/nickel transport system permease protein
VPLLRVIARRVLQSVPLILLVTASTFLLVALIPGDAARTAVGQNATQEQYLEVRDALGLDEPLPVRYSDWLQNALQGDLGHSLVSEEPVTELLDERLGVTLSLVVGATLVAALLGVVLGIGGALRTGIMGKAIDGLSLVGLAIPNFFLGLMLVVWFAVALPLFPATGYVPPEESIGHWLQSLVLPVVTLAVPGVAVIAKQTRDSMREVMERPFIQTLRACGVRPRSVIFKHALRSAAIPVLTSVGIVFIGALSGAVVAESVFALPGLGGLAVEATVQHDVPMIQGVAVYFTVIVISVNLIVDLAYGWLDPRVRVS